MNFLLDVAAIPYLNHFVYSFNRSKKEEVKLPVSPLLAALEGVRNSYQPRAKPPTFSDHTTKEKMRR